MLGSTKQHPPLRTNAPPPAAAAVPARGAERGGTDASGVPSAVGPLRAWVGSERPCCQQSGCVPARKRGLRRIGRTRRRTTASRALCPPAGRVPAAITRAVGAARGSWIIAFAWPHHRRRSTGLVFRSVSAYTSSSFIRHECTSPCPTAQPCVSVPAINRWVD